MSSTEKSQLRSHYLSLLTSLEKKDERSQELFLRLSKDGVFLNVSTVSVFISLPSELSILPIVTHLWEQNIQVLVPLLPGNMNDFSVELREWTPDDPLRKSSYGLSVPSSERNVPLGDVDLLLVPALAFTPDGFRLGRGMGFYDRLLSVYTGTSLGLCFREQIADSLALEKHDQKVDRVYFC